MARYVRVVWLNRKYIGNLAAKWTGTIFAGLGFVGTFVSLSDLLNEQIGLFKRIGISISILVIIWIFAFVGNGIYIFKKHRFEILDVGNNHHVYVQYGDIFSPEEVLNGNLRRNVVISVNRCFDTIVDDDLISSTTLHGMALKKLYAANIYTELTLNQVIQEQLEASGGSAECLTRQEKRSGNLKRYSAGTVAEVKVDQQLHYFLLGLTRFDKNLHPHKSDEEYAAALVKLLEFCNSRSQGFPVVMPLIGAGAANDTGKNERDILEYMVKSIKLNRNLVNCDIHIVVRDSGKDSIGIADII